MKQHILDDLIASVKRQNLQIKQVVIRQDGDVIATYDFDKVKPRHIQSVSKAFTAMAVGIAEDEGLLTLNDKVADYFPEMPKPHMNNHLRAMTIHHLLCMGTGHGECPVKKHDWKKDSHVDIAKLFFAEQVVHAPGTRFMYNNAATYMLSRIITKVTGESMKDYMDIKLFKPLCMQSISWKLCPMGYTLGFAGLFMDADALSRFGQVLLDEGVWEGRRLVPQDFIRRASAVQIATTLDAKESGSDAGYGYQIWVNDIPGTYRMEGRYGQYVVILPKKRAVVVYLSEEMDTDIDVLECTLDTWMDKL